MIAAKKDERVQKGDFSYRSDNSQTKNFQVAVILKTICLDDDS